MKANKIDELRVQTIKNKMKLNIFSGTAMYQLLVIQAFRPDRVIAAAQNFVSAVLGPEFMYQAEKELDLAACVEKEIR